MQIGRLYNAVGPIRTTDISHNPVSTTLGTPIYLPTAEPAGDDFAYTIAEGHLPDITGSAMDYKLCALVIHSGFNEALVTRNVSYRFLVNDVSKRTGSYNATANQYWTWTHLDTFDIKVGDKVSCRAWSTNQDSDIYWDYQGLLVLLTRVKPLGVGVVDDLSTTGEITLLTGIAAGVAGLSRLYFGDHIVSTQWNTPQTFTLVRLSKVYGFIQQNRGDATLTSQSRSNASRQFSAASHPTSFTYRPVGDL